MSDVCVGVAPVSEYATLNELYVQWGYHGGIAGAEAVYVARADGEPKGIVRRAREFGVVMLRGMYVAPESHRRGIGTCLLRAFVDDLPRVECYCVPFAHLIAFYAQGGFSVVGEAQAPAFLQDRVGRYRAEGREVLIMRRP